MRTVLALLLTALSCTTATAAGMVAQGEHQKKSVQRQGVYLFVLNSLAGQLSQQLEHPAP